MTDVDRKLLAEHIEQAKACTLHARRGFDIAAMVPGINGQGWRSGALDNLIDAQSNLIAVLEIMAREK